MDSFVCNQGPFASPAERGAILLLALVFLLSMAVVVSGVMQTSVLQLHMAGNDQLAEQAFHTAQAAASELSLGADNFPMGTQAGQSNCLPGDRDRNCAFRLLAAVQTEVPEGVVLEYRITRQPPLVTHGFPVREAQSAVSGSNSFDAALFEIDVRVDGSRTKLGSSHVIQGIAERIPAAR